MAKEKSVFRLLNSGNLARAIAGVIGGTEEQIRQDVEKYLIPRLDFMYNDSEKNYFVFEEQYVETEWKDMISVHYINTSYNVKSTVMRIHIFHKKIIDQEFYLGCFTLRTMDDVRFMLSYIYPNWNNVITNDGSEFYVMTCKKSVHIMGTEIVFPTYPLFVQDNAVVKCAQASMMAMSSYLHTKYDYNKMRILDINQSYTYGKTKTFPSSGLTPLQMLEIFNHYDISVEFRSCHGESAELQNYVDFCIESALPVLLGLTIRDESKNISNKHIVQVIGHTLDGDEKNYLIYDDSGYFFRSLDNEVGFVKGISWDDIDRGILPQNSFVIYPVHEKIYILFDDIVEVFDDLSKRMKLEEALQKAGEEIVKKRILMVDNRCLKRFLKSEIVLDKEFGDLEKMQKEIDRILQKSLTHYVWYCEFQTENRNLIFFADPTYNNKTTKNIVINECILVSKNVLGLLSGGSDE